MSGYGSLPDQTVELPGVCPQTFHLSIIAKIVTVYGLVCSSFVFLGPQLCSCLGRVHRFYLGFFGPMTRLRISKNVKLRLR